MMEHQNSTNPQTSRSREIDYDKILHFGALISINPSGDEFSNRYMFTDGFAVKNIILKSFSDGQNDFSGSLFRVIPPYTYDVQKQMNSKIHNYENVEAVNNKPNDENTEDILEELNHEMKLNSEKLMKFKRNSIIFGQSIQLEHVKSQKFLAFHPDQGNFGISDNFILQLEEIPSQFSLFKILPCYKYQNERDKFIRFSQDVYIASALENINRDAFLCLSSKLNNPFERSSVIPEKNQEENESDIEEASLNDDFMIVFEKSAKFMINLYCECPEEINGLYFGDVVWISHFEKETCLEYHSQHLKRVKDEIKEDKPEKREENARVLIFEQYNNKEMKSTIGMWQIESENYSKGGAIKWETKLKFRNLSTGLYLSVKQVHQSLAISNIKNYDPKNYELTLEKKASEDTYFILKNDDFETHQEDKTFVDSESFFSLHHYKTRFSLGIKMDPSTRKSGKIGKSCWRPIIKYTASQEDALRLYQAVPHEIWETRFLLSCLPIIKRGIRLIRIMNSEQEINNRYTLKFSRKTQLEELKECLHSVMNFVFCESQYQQSDLEINYNLKKPNYKRQKILREQGFLDLISQLVEKAFPSPQNLSKIEQIDAESRDSKRKIQKMQTSKFLSSRKSFWVATKKTLLESENETISLFVEICRVSYELIKGICKENYENQIECFNYFRIFKKHVGFHLGSTSCLISVLKSNEKLLMLIHNPEGELENFAQLLQKKTIDSSPTFFRSSFKNNMESTMIHFFLERYEQNLKIANKTHEFWPKLLDFLNTLCRFKNQGITVNQILIHEAILQNESRNKMTLIEIIGKPADMTINLMLKTHGKDIFYELVEFYTVGKDYLGESLKDFQKIIIYLEKQLELFSNLCFGRNYVNIKYIKQNLNMSILMNYIWKAELPQELRAVLISLLINVHIDSKPRTERKAPMYIKKLSPDSRVSKQPDSGTHDLTKSVEVVKKTESKSDKFHDVVVDITKIKAFTKTLQSKLSKNTNYRPFSDKNEVKKSGIELGRMASKEFPEVNPEIIEEFIKEDDSIKEEEMKQLKEKILEFLQNEIFTKSPTLAPKHKSVLIKEKEIIFNELLLNIVQLVRKLILFECFTPYKVSSKDPKAAKIGFFWEKKEKTQTDFTILVKHLFVILEFESKSSDSKRKKTQSHIPKKSLANQFLNKMGDVTDTVKNIATGLGQIFFTQSTTKEVPKRKKRESVVNNSLERNEFFASGINLRRKFLLSNIKDGNEANDPFDVQIKIEILHILLFILDLRHDNFLSLIIEFIQRSILENEPPNKTMEESFVDKTIKNQFHNYLPPIMETGLPSEVDSKENAKNSPFDDLDRIYEKKLLPLLLFSFNNSQDYRLNHLLLTLIFKCFNQRARLVHSFKRVQILIDEREHILYDQLNKKVLQLKFICEQSEIWLTTPQKMNSSKFNYKFVIFRVNDLLKELIEILYGSVDFENQCMHFLENRLDDSDIDPLRQAMMRNLDVHTIILKLLKDGSYVLEEINEKDENNMIIVQIFERAYEFLLKLCKKDNKENKKLLYKELTTFIQHLEYFEVGQTNLICEIFRNNYKIAVQVTEELISAFLNKISTGILNKGGHDPKYLDFFENILFDKTEPIKENHLKTINLIFDSNKKYDFLFMIQNPYPKQVEGNDKSQRKASENSTENKNSGYSEKFQHFGHHIFNFEPEDSSNIPYIYHARALRILYSCLQSSSDKQLLKFICQKILNLNYIFDLLTKPDIYFDDSPKAFLVTILNKELTKIVNEVWLNSEKPPSSIFNNRFVLKYIKTQTQTLKTLRRTDIESIKETRRSTVFRLKALPVRNQNDKEIEIIEEDKAENSDEAESDNEKEVENARYQEIVKLYGKNFSFDYIESLLNEILPLMISLNKVLFLNEKNIDDMNCREDLKAISEYADQFIHFYKNNINQSDILQHKGAIKILEEFNKVFNCQLDLPEEKEIEDLKLENLEKEIEEEIELPLQSLLNHHKKDFLSNKENLWRVFILNFLTNEHVKGLIKPERDALILAIKEIENLEYSEEILKRGNNPTLEQFIKKLVAYIKLAMESNQNEEFDINIINQVFVLFSDLIESCDEAEEKARMQTLMNKCNVSKMLLFMLCNPNIDQVTFISMIDLCIRLLDGGNTEVQGSFYEFFINTPNSENFFAKLNNLINEEINYLSKPKSIHEKVDSCLKNMEFSYRIHTRFNIANILRLLQLLTENHNVSLQNYFRYQFKSRNNYDIPNSIVKLLEALLKELTETNYYKILQCFDTLTEFIQGPCEANQIALAEGKFIDIACILLEKNDSFDFKKEKKSNKKIKNDSEEKLSFAGSIKYYDNMKEANNLKFQHKIIRYIETISKNFARSVAASFHKHSSAGFENWMLSRLKYKCVITLESILEGQNDNFILRKMRKTLPSNLIKENIACIYERYVRLYRKKYLYEAFNHSELDPKILPSREKEKLGMIIETAFKLFIILKKYIEDVEIENNNEEDDDDDKEEAENLDILKQEFDNIFGENNIVGQISALGMDLIRTGFTAVEKLGKITKIISSDDDQPSDEKLLKEYVKQNRLLSDALRFFGKYVAHIEINRNNKLFRQYFPILPHCLCLDKAQKNWFHDHVNRLSVKSKIASLVSRSKDMIYTMKHEEQLKDFFNKRFISLLAKHVQLWKDLSFFTCIAQNWVILVITNHDTIYEWSIIFSRNKNGSEDYFFALFLLEIVQIVCSFLMWFFFICKRAPLVLAKADEHILLIENPDKNSQFNEYQTLKQISTKAKIFIFLRNLLIKIKFLCFDPLILYYMLYTGCAILGMFNSVFIAFLLLDVFLRFPLILHVFKSIWRPKKQILMTIVLFFIFQYFFTIIAFYFLYDTFDGWCDNLYTCFSVIFDQSYKSNGAIGGFFAKQRPDYIGWTLDARSIYDLVYEFVLIILITQIIAGIIIDTFAVLREEEGKKKNDKENFCFICGFDRETLDKKSKNQKGFQYHVKIEHNMWNYLFFISHLKNKEKTEYSGFESFVAEKLELDDINWFPLHQAMSLSSKKELAQEKNKRKNGLCCFLEEKLEGVDKKLQGFQLIASRNKKNYEDENNNII